MIELLLIVCLFLTAKTIIRGDRFGLSLKCESAIKAERHYQIVWAAAIGVILAACLVRL
jgi:hypothetical protein